MAYRVKIEPEDEHMAMAIVISDAFGAIQFATNIHDAAIAWLVDHGCWPREAAHVRTFQPNTVYWITADRPAGSTADAP